MQNERYTLSEVSRRLQQTLVCPVYLVAMLGEKKVELCIVVGPFPSLAY